MKYTCTCNLDVFFFCLSDSHTLVELVNFSATGKMQPFSVDISTNCLLLMVSVTCRISHCISRINKVRGWSFIIFEGDWHWMATVPH